MSWFTGFQTLPLGLMIFLARICDVSVGTQRTISMIDGRTMAVFFLGLAEVGLWLVVITPLTSAGYTGRSTHRSLVGGR